MNNACKGWQCLTRLPENPDKAGWRDGYCPECLEELARDEIREERQATRNETDTPETLALFDVGYVEEIKLQLNEVLKSRDAWKAEAESALEERDAYRRERDEARRERDALQTVAGELIVLIRKFMDATKTGDGGITQMATVEGRVRFYERIRIIRAESHEILSRNTPVQPPPVG